MGTMTALAISQSDEMTLEQQIGLHFAANCYPPIPAIMIEPSIEAIDAMIDDEPDRLIDLPDGVSFRGYAYCTAYDIVDGHHLWSWVE